MTFNKPIDVTYTQMCIYIDNNIYSESFDVELVYQYLYHIVLMLAQQASLFQKHKYYDPFALFGATRIYFRLTNPKQNQLKDDGSPKMERIKSVLNYAKNVLYPLKVDFEQSEYCQSFSNVSKCDELSYNYDNIVKDSIDGLSLVDFKLTLQDVGKTCKKFLSTIPYPMNSSEWLNIYVSVMLTFLNSVTIRNKSSRRVAHLQHTNRLKDSHIDDFFQKEKYSEPILFHLDPSMRDYVIVLARQLRSIVASDLSDILHTSITSDFELVNMCVNNFMKEQEDRYEN